VLRNLTLKNSGLLVNVLKSTLALHLLSGKD